MSARVGWLLLFALLTACDPIRPAAARYACERNKPLETQCLDGWRCGADGFCFDPSGTGALPSKCEDPATDCPTGWKCSLAQQCFDPAAQTAVSLPCRDPKTDCPDEWKCGLDQRCLDPNQPGPWRCADTATDCTGGWTCGAEGLCFDRADAGRVSCRKTVPTDCNDGWRCGIDGLCQQLDAGAPWPCLVDGDCEANWRCGPAERCVDSTNEALRPNDGMPLGGPFGFPWPAGVPDDLALGISEEPPRCSSESSSTNTASGALRFGSRLELFAVRGNGGDLPTGCDGGAPTGGVPVLTGRVDLGATQARQLAQFEGTTFVLVDGGVRTYTLKPGGQVEVAEPFTGNYERLLTNPSKPCLLAIGLRRLACLKPELRTYVDGTRPLLAVDGGEALIRDAVIWRYSSSDFVIFAATNQGLFAWNIDGQGVPFGGWWQHVEWGDSVSVIDELRLAPQVGAPSMLQALVREDGGSETLIWTFGIRRFNGTVDAGTVSTWGGNYGPVFTRPIVTPSPPSGWYELGWGQSYVSCPEGARGWLQGARPGNNPSGVGSTRALHRCPASDGGLELFQTLNEPSGTASFPAIDPRSEVPPLTRSALWVRNDESTVAMADGTGGLFVASTLGDAIELEPWLPKEVPTAVSGRLNRWLMAQTPGRELSLGNGIIDATMREGLFLGSTDAGFGAISRRLPPGLGGGTHALASGVEGAPDLSVYAVTGTNSVTYLVEADEHGPLLTERSSIILALPDGGVTSPEVPVYARGPEAGAGMHSALAPGGNAKLWYLTRDDQLLVAAVDAPVPVFNFALAIRDPEIPVARVILSPLPGIPLTHVLGLPADPSVGAAYGQVLAVAAGRLFHVRADTAAVWRSTEQSDSTSEVIKSWADGSRVRFGDREGRVRSFPSRVVIGPPLRAGSSAWDFVDVCGVTYALSNDGVFRLAATAGVPIGTWVPVPLPASLRFTRGGSLYSDGSGLVVFDEQGRMAEVSGLTCAQPL